MNRNLAFTLILALLTASCISSVKPTWATAAPDSWTTKAPMHEARYGLGVAVVHGKIYAIGGYAGIGPTLSTNEEYDPTTDTWTFKAPMPTSRMSFGIAVWENKVYCIGGIGGSGGTAGHASTSTNEAYDPVSNTWENRTPLPIAREGIRASAINGVIYVVGGTSNDTDAYDIATDSWSKKSSMPVIPNIAYGWSCTSSVVDSKIHVIGIGRLPVSGDGVAFHQIYDPAIDSWSLGAEWLSGGTYGAAGSTTGMMAPKRIYVFGVDSYYWPLGSPNFKNLVYSPENDSWSYGALMPTLRINAAVANVNDTLYVIGGATTFLGDNSAPNAANEQYIPIEYSSVQPSSSPSPSPTIPELTPFTAFLTLVLTTCTIAVAIQSRSTTHNAKPRLDHFWRFASHTQHSDDR